MNTKNKILVDRSTVPVLPHFARGWEFPDIQSSGPAEFDVSKLELWLAPLQKTRHPMIRGDYVFECLISDNMLDSCAGLCDLEEIQKKGIAFFRKHFKGQRVFGWKSSAFHRRQLVGAVHRVRAPYLVEIDGKVCLRWRSLWLGWHAYPALRFAS